MKYFNSVIGFLFDKLWFDKYLIFLVGNFKITWKNDP
jgi:hypothetical protein